MSPILVDTSVWIDFLNGEAGDHVMKLVLALNGRAPICLCGVIKMEILQGFDDDKEYSLTKEKLNNFLNIPISMDNYYMATDIYRKGRKRGFTIRKPNDCLIASVAISNKLELLHNDRDFDAIEKVTTLKVH